MRLIPFMFVLYIVSYLDRINVSFSGKDMADALGFSPEALGGGMGIFFIGYFLFGIPSNMMVERLGARRWISCIMVAWGLVSISTSMVKTPLQFYVVRFLLGVTEAGFFPGMILYLTYWFPKREHARAVASFMTAIPAAGVIGALVASAVLPLHAFGMPGWKLLFFTTGTPSMLFGIVTYFYLTDLPTDATWLSEPERDWLVNCLRDERSLHPAAEKPSPLVAMSEPRVWHLTLLYFTLSFGMYGFQLWLPQIIGAFKTASGAMTTAQTALLTAIPAAGQALGMVVVAGHSDRSGERRWHVFTAAALAGCGLLATSLFSNPALQLAMLSLTALGIWGTVGPFWALPTGYLPAYMAAVAIGLINSVGNLGGFVGPYVVGFVKGHTGDFRAALLCLALSLVCGGLLALAVPKPPQNGEST